MSAAATAAGYLYVHGRLPIPDLKGQVNAERSQRKATSQSWLKSACQPLHQRLAVHPSRRGHHAARI